MIPCPDDPAVTKPWRRTEHDTRTSEIVTNWRARLQRIRRLLRDATEWSDQQQAEGQQRKRPADPLEAARDFTLAAGGVGPHTHGH